MLAALAIIAVLTVQGLGILLPTNLLVYFELRKPVSDGARIGRLMRRYVRMWRSRAACRWRSSW